MKIKIYTISKKAHNYGDYAKMLNSFGVELVVINVMNAKILNAQKISPHLAQESYTTEFMRFIAKDSTNIALDSKGKMMDSIEFSKIFGDKHSVNFFVGGAYGFTKDFLGKMQTLSLSKLTFSHRIIPLILCEQIYRAFCILNNHPYHK